MKGLCSWFQFFFCMKNFFFVVAFYVRWLTFHNEKCGSCFEEMKNESQIILQNVLKTQIVCIKWKRKNEIYDCVCVVFFLFLFFYFYYFKGKFILVIEHCSRMEKWAAGKVKFSTGHKTKKQKNKKTKQKGDNINNKEKITKKRKKSRIPYMLIPSAVPRNWNFVRTDSNLKMTAAVQCKWKLKWFIKHAKGKLAPKAGNSGLQLHVSDLNGNSMVKKFVALTGVGCWKMSNDLGSRSLSIIVVEVASIIILNVLSLAGNTLILISAYTNKRLRTTTNSYIIALALSDLISALIVMPLSTGVLISGKWIYGNAVCQLHAFFSLFAIYVSSVTMGLTAVNRFTRMCKSDQQYKKWFSMKKSLMLVTFVWVFVACYTGIPRLVGLQGYDFVPGYGQCSLIHLSEFGKKIHYAIVIPLFFLIPLTATIFCYVAKMIRQHNTSASATLERRFSARVTIGRQLSQSSKFSAHEINLSKSLFAVVFAFIICWIPFWIIVLLRRFRLVSQMPRNVELLCMFLFYLSNTINPFIYAGMNPAFRREFRKMLLCKKWRQLAVQSASTGGKLTRTEDSQEVVLSSQNSTSLLRLHWVTTPKINSPTNQSYRMRHVAFRPSTSETSCWWRKRNSSFQRIKDKGINQYCLKN